MIEPLPARILSLGDLVGLSYRRFRLHYKLYFKALFWPSLMGSLASHMASFSFLRWLVIAPHSMLAWPPFLFHMSFVVLGVVVWFFSLMEMSLRCSAVVRTELALEPSYADSYALLKKRYKTIFIVYNFALFPPLLCLIFYVVVMFFIVGVIRHVPEQARFALQTIVYGATGFFLTVSVAISSLAASMLLAVVTLESLPFIESCKRTYFFLRHRLWRGGSFACLLAIFVGLVCFALTSPVQIGFALDQFSHSSSTGSAEVPIALQILDTASDTLLNIVVFAIVYTGYGLFYRDLKLRLEGVDITSRLEKIEGN